MSEAMTDAPEGLTDEELDTFALLKLAAQAVLKGDAVSADDKVPSVKIGAATLIRLVTVLHAERTKSLELEAVVIQVREAAERALSLADSYKEALDRTLRGELTDVANDGAARMRIKELLSSSAGQSPLKRTGEKRG